MYQVFCIVASEVDNITFQDDLYTACTEKDIVRISRLILVSKLI